jgi:hypothetical protein
MRAKDSCMLTARPLLNSHMCLSAAASRLSMLMSEPLGSRSSWVQAVPLNQAAPAYHRCHVLL